MNATFTPTKLHNYTLHLVEYDGRTWEISCTAIDRETAERERKAWEQFRAKAEIRDWQDEAEEPAWMKTAPRKDWKELGDYFCEIMEEQGKAPLW